LDLGLGLIEAERKRRRKEMETGSQDEEMARRDSGRGISHCLWTDLATRVDPVAPNHLLFHVLIPLAHRAALFLTPAHDPYLPAYP
jgi:hypothetical protein